MIESTVVNISFQFSVMRYNCYTVSLVCRVLVSRLKIS